MSKKKGENKYNLLELISLMIITALATATITYNVSLFSKTTKKNIVNRADLSELIETYDEINEEFYTKINKKELIEAGIKGMLDYINDPYTMYMDKDEADNFNEELDGQFVGLGVEIMRQNNDVVIYRVLKKSPAERLGLKSKDIIIKVNNKKTEDMTLKELSKEIKGEVGTKVKIVIKRDGKEKEYEFARDTIIIESVKTEIINKNNKKIGYMQISVFANNTFEQFEEEYKKLKKEKIDGLVIDLRSNTGGYLETATNLLEKYLKKGSVMYQFEYKNGKKEKVYSKKDADINIKTVLVVNGGSASASEIFAAGLSENLNVPIVGTKTYGKGKVQVTKKLSSGALIKYTIKNWLTPKGNPIDQKGITPDYLVPLTEKYIKNPIKENDDQLQKALDVITKNS